MFTASLEWSITQLADLPPPPIPRPVLPGAGLTVPGSTEILIQTICGGVALLLTGLVLKLRGRLNLARGILLVVLFAGILGLAAWGLHLDQIHQQQVDASLRRWRSRPVGPPSEPQPPESQPPESQPPESQPPESQPPEAKEGGP